MRSLCSRAEDGTETQFGQDAVGKIWGELVADGYLNAAGDILDKFDPKNPHFELKVPAGICRPQSGYHR